MNDFLSRENEFALRKVEEMFLENIETVFQTGINPEASLQFDAIDSFKKSLISEVFQNNVVTVKIQHKKPVSGDEFLLLSTNTVAMLADLMVMGDGTANFNPDEHLDAIQEISDQIFGAFATTHKNSLNADLEYITAKATVGAEELLHSADESWIAVGFTLKLNGEFQIYHILSPAAVDNFLRDSRAAEKGGSLSFDTAAQAQAGAGPAQVKNAQFQSFSVTEAAPQTPHEIEMLMDLKLPIVIELGRTAMFIKDILKLTTGSIVELDKLSGDPVDIYVNEKKFAEGEVVVIDENFGVRITELVRPEDRLRKLQ